jgi:hypothetical protein
MDFKSNISEAGICEQEKLKERRVPGLVNELSNLISHQQLEPASKIKDLYVLAECLIFRT